MANIFRNFVYRIMESVFRNNNSNNNYYSKGDEVRVRKNAPLVRVHAAFSAVWAFERAIRYMLARVNTPVVGV